MKTRSPFHSSDPSAHSAAAFVRQSVSRSRKSYRWLAAAALILAVHAQATEFTYQGQLQQNAIPVAGLFDFRFELFDAPSGGGSLAMVTKPAVQVTDGLFTVALDFTPHLLDGAGRWLEVGVRPAGGTGMTVLAPRSQVTPTPYAMHADNSPGRAPVGTVVDWWRADPATPVPAGYQLCDGSLVSDPDSPLAGQTVPDLRGKFVMGSSDGATVGQSGGTASHSHAVDLNHDHASHATAPDGAHTHGVDLPSLGSTSASTSVAGAHNHQWLEIYATLGWGTKRAYYYSWNEIGSIDSFLKWDDNDGVGNEGSGFYPIGISGWWTNHWTDTKAAHAHTYNSIHDHPSFHAGTASAHSHSIDYPGLGNLSTYSSVNSNLPPYTGLLKIICVK